MRTRYGDYPEYYTSLDDLSMISAKGLGGAYEGLKKCLILLENNHVYRSTCLGEPQLSKRGLRPTLGARALTEDTMTIRIFCNIRMVIMILLLWPSELEYVLRIVSLSLSA
jgi:aminopeptidase-like protein